MRIGGLCFGYGGLEMAVQQVLGGELAWYAEIDPGACRVAAHRFPGVPNVGDMTAVDWAQVEPVDVLTGGTPCQDLSHAGKRGGMSEGTRSNLWVAMREAIAAIRPALVVWENVQGALSAPADSEMESREGRVGVRPDRPVLRALGRVLGDLAGLGYVGGWHGLRAADVGAPHGRFRVFVVAHAEPVERRPRRLAAGGSCEPHGEPSGRRRVAEPPAINSALTLLPTPAVNDMGEGKTPDAWDAWTERMKAEHANGNGHGKSLSIEAQRLLPTPDTMNHRDGSTLRQEHIDQGGSHGLSLHHWAYEQGARLLPTPQSQDAKGHLPGNATNRTEQGRQVQLGHVVGGGQWGAYAAAIARWEHLTRPAPPPTQPSRKGTPQLSPAFSEWLMGLPDGWVTDVPGITRNQALRALGNGVVPQQAEAALRFLLALEVPA